MRSVKPRARGEGGIVGDWMLVNVPGGLSLSNTMKERRLWLALGVSLGIPLVRVNWSRVDDLVDALRASLGYRVTLKALCGDDTVLYREWRKRPDTISAEAFVRLWRTLEGQGVVVPYSDLLLPVAHAQRVQHKRIQVSGLSVTLAPLRSRSRP